MQRHSRRQQRFNCKYSNIDLSGNSNTQVTAFKQDVGNKIKSLTEKDIGFKNIIDGQTNKASDAMAPFIEVALRYGGNDPNNQDKPFYDSSQFTYKGSAKVWFQRDEKTGKGTGQFVVKAVWYVDKDQKYRTIIMEDASKPGGISTTVEKVIIKK